jgi:hypothetical protein
VGKKRDGLTVDRCPGTLSKKCRDDAVLFKTEILKEALEHAMGSKNVWPALFARGLCKVV